MGESGRLVLDIIEVWDLENLSEYLMKIDFIKEPKIQLSYKKMTTTADEIG